jgi:hypothetical protein
MRITGEDGLLELEPFEIGPPGTPAESDLRLSVTVKMDGYSAADECWVIAGQWDTFLKELRELDHRRQGRAVVIAASPDDLQLEFYSTDSAGHMAVRGYVGWHKPNSHFLQLRFGFSF